MSVTHHNQEGCFTANLPEIDLKRAKTRQIMFTEPKTVLTDELTTRSYVTFYLNRKRIREYNGNNLNLIINPNRAKSKGERNQLLRKLQFELHKALEANCYPAKKEAIEQCKPLKQTVQNLLLEALNKKLDSDLSKTYKRNLRNIHRQFITFFNRR